MAGLDKNIPNPTEIKLHQRSRLLEIHFTDGSHFKLPCEYLRVFSPSAEVRGHGPGQKQIVAGKRDVGIARIEPVGNYAARLVFDDGHDSGLYTWRYLAELGETQDKAFAAYLAALAARGLGREP